MMICCRSILQGPCVVFFVIYGLKLDFGLLHLIPSFLLLYEHIGFLHLLCKIPPKAAKELKNLIR